MCSWDLVGPVAAAVFVAAVAAEQTAGVVDIAVAATGPRRQELPAEVVGVTQRELGAGFAAAGQ